MPEQDKITLALKEIKHCEALTVKVADGIIVSIPKQRVYCRMKDGIRTEKDIPEEVKR